MMHFHGPADSGVNAGVLIPIPITTNEASGSTSGTAILADSTENYLLEGKLYYNAHTDSFPTGEIRG